MGVGCPRVGQGVRDLFLKHFRNGERLMEKKICGTCGRAVDNPFRLYDDHGKITSGCVDDSHDGHLITPSESARWHGRKEARMIRLALRKYRS